MMVSVSVSSFGLVVRRMGSFSYTPRAGNCLFFRRVIKGGVSLTRPVLEPVSSFVGRGVSLTRSVLQSVWSLSGSGVSLTRPVLESVSSFVGWGMSCCYLSRRLAVGEFLLHAPCWTLSCRSSVGESLFTRPVPVCVSCSVRGRFLLHAP